jgi:16S rRNA (guanine(1405)-N(7))-methyltransferase
LLLKALPPLEQSDRTIALRLLQALQAEHILVSFPTRTLGGRSKQMGAHYETRFRALIAGENWQTERFEFANELCFLVSK